jgi:hypothetical protein
MISSIYTSENPEWGRISDRLSLALRGGIEKFPHSIVFFRADDIAVPSAAFSRMMDAFIKFNMPLCLAVVPTWLTVQRWEILKQYAGRHPDLFCWHLHGWRHVNHEVIGKKQEFGPGRPLEQISHDLARGKAHLEKRLGPCFSPYFTPPWNRCGSDTLTALKMHGFKGISRDSGASPKAPEGVAQIDVNVDLHTRKDKDSESGWEALFRELEQGLASGLCGVMLHHMRMNEQAFIFLDLLLERMSGLSGIRLETFNTI